MTNYTAEFDIEAGDKLRFTAESPNDALDGEFDSEAASDQAGNNAGAFERVVPSGQFWLDSDPALKVNLRRTTAFDERDDVIAHIELGDGREAAKVTAIEVLD